MLNVVVLKERRHRRGCAWGRARGVGSGRGHRDVVGAGDDRGGLAVVVGVGIDVDGEAVVERGGVGIVVRVRRERCSTLLRLGSGLVRLRGLRVKGGLKGLGARCIGLELPFKDAGPILRAFFVELIFPFFFCFFTGDHPCGNGCNCPV
jgi:hypothetical protein